MRKSFTACCAFLAIIALHGENLLKNSDFKMTPGKKEIPGWTMNKELSIQGLRNTVIENKACLEILTTNATYNEKKGAKNNGILSQKVKINPGKTYSLTIVAKRDSFVYGTTFHAVFFIKGKAQKGVQEKTFRSASWEPTTMVFPSREADEVEIQIINPNTGIWRITKGRSLFLESASLTEINHQDDLKFTSLKPGKNVLSANVASSGEYYLWLKADALNSSRYTLKTKSGKWDFQSYTPGQNRWIRPVLPELLLSKGKGEIEFTIDEKNANAHELLLTMDPFYEPSGITAFLKPGPDCPSTKPDLSKEIKSGKIELSIDSELPQGKWGITQGIPFPLGSLRDATKLRLEGHPVQSDVLAKWADGSVKWLQVSTFASGKEKMTLQYGTDIKADTPNSSLKVEKTDTSVKVDTGKLRFEIPSDGSALMKNIVCAKRTIKEAVLFLNGNQAASAQEIKIEESGPVRAAIKVSGKFVKNPKFSYTVRIFAYAGSDYLEMEHSLILSQDGSGKVENCGINFNTDINEVSFKAGNEWIKCNNESIMTADLKSPASNANDFPYEIISEGKKLSSGLKAEGMMKIPGEAPVSIAIRNFWQNAPKAFKVSKDSFSLNIVNRELMFYQGMARTHSIVLSLSETDAPLETFMRRPLLLATPEWYCNSKAYHAWPLSVPEANWALYEASVEDTIEKWGKRIDKSMTDPTFYKGMMFYGETGSLEASNNLETALDEGGIVQYLRSCKREYFDFADKCISHFADVDIDHSNGKSAGHIYVHGKYERKSTNHEANGHSWFNGTLTYGFFTASKRIMEIADQVGRYHSKELPEWNVYDYVHYWRRPAWQFMGTIQGWDATGNWEYLQMAKKIAELTKMQRDHIVSLWPYMFTVGMRALREYYETTGDPEVREVYLQIFDGYMRLRTRPNDTSFGEHAKAPGMLLGNYPNDRSCCFYGEAAQADWMAGLKRYAVPAGRDLTIQLEYGINDPTFLWGSADLLRAMKADGMKLEGTPPTSPLVVMTPPTAKSSPLAKFKCPVVSFQFEKKTDKDFDIFLYNRPVRKYSGFYFGTAIAAAPDGKIIDTCQVRTDGMRSFKLHVPKDGKTGTYTVFITLQNQWRWTIENIQFKLKKGEHEIKLLPRYDRIMIDAVCLAKTGTFNPFKGNGTNKKDYTVLQAENGIILKGFVKVEDISAENKIAVRKSTSKEAMTIKINVPEDGVYDFFAKIWKGGPDLIEVSVDSEKPVNCSQVHDMENNDYTSWSIGTTLGDDTVITAGVEKEPFKNMQAIFFDGSGMKKTPAFETVRKFIEGGGK